MAREYVPIFFDWLENTQDLSAEEKGHLIDAVIMYASGADEWIDQLQTSGEKIAFRFMRGQIDRNTAISEARAKAGASKKEQSGTNKNKREQKETKIPKEKKEEKEKEKENNNNRAREDDDDDLRQIQADHDRVLDAAEDAGFIMSNDVRATLISLYADYGLQKVLDGLRSCVEHGAPNLAYLKAVLRGEPRKPPGKTVPAQQYGQRDYSSEQDEAMARMLSMMGGADSA